MTVYMSKQSLKVKPVAAPLTDNIGSVDNVNGRGNTAINILRSFKNYSVVHLYLFVTEYYMTL